MLGTYNPSGWSFYHWIAAGDGALPLQALVGLALVILYVIYLRATWRSVGAVGTAVAVACYGVIDLEAPGVAVFLLLFVLATVMAIGLSWSHVRRRLSGQADVDDVEV